MAEDADNDTEAAVVDPSLPPMDFSTFVLSLGSSAAVNLGQIPPPGANVIVVDVAPCSIALDAAFGMLKLTLVKVKLNQLNVL